MSPGTVAASNQVEVTVARMEGKLDQVISDHERRLAMTDTAITGLIESHNRLNSTVAQTSTRVDNVVQDVSQLRTDLTADITEVRERQGSAVARVMQVMSPAIALGSLVLAFIIYMSGM